MKYMGKGMNNSIKKGVVVAVVLLFVSVSVVPLTIGNEVQSVKEKIYVTPDIYLKTNFLPLLKKTLLFGDDVEFKHIIQEIIAVIEDKGYADNNDLLEIILDSDVGITNVYGFAKIETSSKTDGWAYPFPGYYRSIFGFLARGSYVYYKSADWINYGWHLTINGEDIEEGTGHIIGYFGIILNHIGPDSANFEFKDGLGLLVFHKTSVSTN